MSGTALDHPAVRDYLRQLDAALLPLPSDQARELLEQITAHIEDELPPGASDAEIAAALRRLGSPKDLASEARRTSAQGISGGDVARWLTSILRRPGWRFWVLTGVFTFLAASVIGWNVAADTAEPLQMGGWAQWWYPQDARIQVESGQGIYATTTVPIRSGLRQGIVLSVCNHSSWTQTILSPTNLFSSPFGSWTRIGVSSPNKNVDRGGSPFGEPVSFGLPAAIPPQQCRALQITWRSTFCMTKGDFNGLSDIPLEVLVGWQTRTEVISLFPAFDVAGPEPWSLQRDHLMTVTDSDEDASDE